MLIVTFKVPKDYIYYAQNLIGDIFLHKDEPHIRYSDKQFLLANYLPLQMLMCIGNGEYNCNFRNSKTKVTPGQIITLELIRLYLPKEDTIEIKYF